MGILISAIKIIFLLGFLIFIHEGGHFTVAKLCKVKVNQFAIGFGPQIFSFQGKETKYALRLIPLGGFVSMEGEEGDSKDIRAYNKASKLKRLAIVFSGPIVNIVFGFLIYFILISVFYKNIGTGVNATIGYFKAIIESIVMLFTGKVGVEGLTGPVGISELVSKTTRNCRIYKYDVNDFCITWNNQPFANTCIRWWKNSTNYIRGYKKKAT